LSWCRDTEESMSTASKLGLGQIAPPTQGTDMVAST
jgi:hypothetical protein